MSYFKHKPFLSVLMAALLTASLMSGCSGQGQTTSGEKSSGSVSAVSQAESTPKESTQQNSGTEASAAPQESSEAAPAEKSNDDLDVPADYVPTSEDAFDGEIIGGKIQITSYTGTDTNVKIPKTLGGKTVDSIAPKTFTGNKKITDITIPAGITVFENAGQGAFMDCTNLKSATVYSRVLTKYFFTNCTSLKTVKLGSNTEQIDDYAFGGCTSLEEIVLPDKLSRIGEYAFGHYNSSFTGENIPACTSLKKVVLGKETQVLDHGAFKGCTALKEINLDPVKTFADHCFEGCTSLPDITINEITGTKRFFGSYSFANCTSMKSVTFVPEKMNLSTASYAFGFNVTFNDYSEAVPSVRSDFVVYADKFTDGAAYAKANNITCKNR